MAKTYDDWHAALINPDIQRELRRRLLTRHARDTRNLDPRTTRPLVIRELPDRDLPLLVTDGDILVRREDQESAAAILKGLGFGPPAPAACTANGPVELPVVIFSRPGASVDQLKDAIEKLIGAGINASFNHVLPDGGVKNGSTGPAKVADPMHLASPSDSCAGDGVVVAVIDTGIAKSAGERDDPANPAGDRDTWLSGIAITSDNVDPLNAINQNDTPPTDYFDLGAGHGTFVAGVIRQIAPKADVRVYRALDSDGIGTEVGAACAIVQAWRDGANIINLSLGQETYMDRPPVALQAALDVISDDVIVVAAAGNLDHDRVDEATATRPHWPAAFRRVVAVGATNAGYAGASWSKRGHWVDVSTWGEDVISTYVQGEEDPNDPTNPNADTWEATDKTPWARWSGTSFAAPQIAGMIAARVAPSRYAQRCNPRQALAELLSRPPSSGTPAGADWYEDKYGVIVRTPFLS